MTIPHWKGENISDLDNNYLVNLRNWIKKKEYTIENVIYCGGGGYADEPYWISSEDDECLLDVYAEVCNEIFKRLEDGRLDFEYLRGRL